MSSPNPFRPRPGVMPPYLAGRATEQAVLGGVFEDLRGEVPTGPVVLYGPRGNGKTTLMAWAEAQVTADEALDGFWLTPADIRGPEDLRPRLQLTSWMQKIAPQNISVAGVGVGLRDSVREPLLADALIARSKDRPFVLFMDEAHTIEPEVGRVLLNAAQTAARKSPFLLLLAGTPDLEDRLAGIGASFWNRADIHAIGRIDPEATAEAIERPLKAAGSTIEDAALERIVRESHGYPYFVQLWGRAVWNGMAASSGSDRRVTTAVVEEAAGEFEATKDSYYRLRFNELDEDDLLPAACEVAMAFRGRDRLRHAELREAIRRATAGGDGPDEKTVARALRHLGLVWQTKVAPVWEPGIPSLMDYLLEYASEPPA